MSSKLKIFQYHNSHLYNLKQYRIALEVGVYNSREGFLSVLGSNQRLAWEFKKWLPIVKKIYVTTSLPISIDINLDTKSLLIDIIKLIDGLNVSLQHYDSRINNVVLHASSKHDRLETLFMLTHINPEIRNKIRVNLNLVQGYIDNKIEVLKAIRLLSNVYHVKTIKLNELQNSDKYVSFENIFPDCELSSPYAHGCQIDITHYFDSLSLMHDIQILLKRSCFLVEPSKTATFSDLVKVVGKRIKNEKHKFGVLYENGKLESHWLTNEEINNKTR